MWIVEVKNISKKEFMSRIYGSSGLLGMEKKAHIYKNSKFKILELGQF